MKIFQKNDNGFTCENCGVEVLPLDYSSRDHCSACLFGKHVDNNPGDRANDCHGLLKPIGFKISSGKSQIVYDCMKCKERAFCVAANDDNQSEIMRVSTKVWI